MWGINGSSCLLQIKNFSLVSALVHDSMHLFLEVIVPHDLRLMLKAFHCCCQILYFEHFNNSLEGIKYSYLHSDDKPEKIEHNHINPTGTIKQTAAAMLTLIQVLPFIIGWRIPSENRMWLNFLRLLQIVLLCTSPFTLLYC